MSILEQYPWPSGLAGEYDLPTPYGTPRVRVIGQGAVAVTGGIPHNVREQSDRTALTINGVSYSVQAHFHKWGDGRYHAGREDSRENWREPHLSRRDNRSDVTRSAMDKARAALEDAVNEWVGSHPHEMEAGAARWRAECAHALARQVDECRTALELVERNLRNCVNGFPFDTYPLAQTPKIKEGNGR